MTPTRRTGASAARVVLAHGGGGELMNKLISEHLLGPLQNDLLSPLEDGAILPRPEGDVVFTTDSYVVQPLFFAGGDIGKLAVCGTVNDLAVKGAKPLYLTLGLVVEEGLAVSDLATVLASIAETAERAQVAVAAGDTKVVERGTLGGLIVNTAGIGVIPDDRVISGDRVEEGAVMLVLEAMKMEHQLVTHAAGVVKEVRVEVGQMVDPDAVLIVVEADE